MDKQSQLILEKVLLTKGLNPKNRSKNLIGGRWTEDSSFIRFKNMSQADIGRWGELMFEESFGLKSKSVGLDLPSLKADIKTFTRAYERTKFGGGASIHNNPDWYFLYLIFPNEYQLYRVPSSDQCIRERDGERKGAIDITGEDIHRFIQLNYIYQGDINFSIEESNLLNFFE